MPGPPVGLRRGRVHLGPADSDRRHQNKPDQPSHIEFPLDEQATASDDRIGTPLSAG